MVWTTVGSFGTWNGCPSCGRGDRWRDGLAAYCPACGVLEVTLTRRQRAVGKGARTDAGAVSEAPSAPSRPVVVAEQARKGLAGSPASHTGSHADPTAKQGYQLVNSDRRGVVEGGAGNPQTR